MIRFRKDKVKQRILELYKGIQKDVENKENKWLNLGYWKNASIVDNACQDLINYVIEFSKINEGEIVLDAGFGYGDQDIHILNQFSNLIIHGVNITDFQVEHAKNIAKSNGFNEKYFPKVSDASKLKYEDDFFDKVISVEAAFHFNTREKFLNECYRVLKTKGVVCIVDCLPKIKGSEKISKKSFKHIGIPDKNLIDIESYFEILKKIGFTEIEFHDLSEYVLPYFNELTKHGDWRNDAKIVLTKEERIRGLIEWRNKTYYETAIHDYIIIRAVKKV